MDSRFKVWYIKGAASGFGPALIRMLLSSGQCVAATADSFAQLELMVGEEHRNFLPLETDFCSEASVQASYEMAIATFGRIDVVLNNTYSNNASSEIANLRPSLTLFETSLLGVINITRNIMPHFRRQASGRIIHIQSTKDVYHQYSDLEIPYSTETILAEFMRSVALQAKRFNIHITSIPYSVDQPVPDLINTIVRVGMRGGALLNSSYCN